MTAQGTVAKSALKLGAAQVFIQLCTLLRSAIVARLIAPEDFGIAITFVVTYALLEMISNLSVDMLLVQASDGGEPRFQQTAQAVLLCRGVGTAAVLFAVAVPVAVLFGVPQATWAFQCLALIPLIRGATHMDIYRLQRDMHFGPVLAADVGSNAVAVLAALPIVLWRRDYSAMLWLLTLQTAVYVSITHLAAKRIYRCTWDRAYVQRILSFGWPLLFNGLLMYGIFQGDRFVIGASGRLFGNSRYTLSDLAVYSVGFSFMMSISMFMISVTSQLFLPLLSRVQVAREQFARRYRGCCYAVCSLSVLAVVPFVLVGGWVIRLVYGPHYAAAGSFVGWIAAMFGVRLLRAAPTLAATALGDTRNALVSNIVRTVGLAGVLAAAAVNGPLWWIAASGFAGEVAALVVCLWRLERQHQVPAKSMVKPVWITSAGCATAGLAARAAGNSGIVVGWACAALIVAATLTAMIVAAPELCQELGTIITRRSRGKSHDSREWLTPGSTGTQS